MSKQKNYSKALELLENNLDASNLINWKQLIVDVREAEPDELGENSLGNTIVEICYNPEINIDMLEGLDEIPEDYFSCRTVIPDEIIIPNSVKNIGICAFNFTDIKKIILPDNLKSIGDSAFAHCRYLKTIDNINPNIEGGANVFNFSGITYEDIFNFANAESTLNNLNWNNISTNNIGDRHKTLALNQTKISGSNMEMSEKFGNKVLELMRQYYSKLITEFNAKIDENTGSLPGKYCCTGEYNGNTFKLMLPYYTLDEHRLNPGMLYGDTKIPARALKSWAGNLSIDLIINQIKIILEQK